MARRASAGGDEGCMCFLPFSPLPPPPAVEVHEKFVASRPLPSSTLSQRGASFLSFFHRLFFFYGSISCFLSFLGQEAGCRKEEGRESAREGLRNNNLVDGSLTAAAFVWGKGSINFRNQAPRHAHSNNIASQNQPARPAATNKHQPSDPSKRHPETTTIENIKTRRQGKGRQSESRAVGKSENERAERKLIKRRQKNASMNGRGRLTLD